MVLRAPVSIRLAACVLALAWAANARAQADRKAWATVLGRDTLAQATLGVVGKIERLADVSGTRVSVLAIAVEQVIWGELPPGETVLKAVRPERGTPEELRTRAAVFLQPMRSSWRVIGMFQADGDEGKRTLALLERHLAIERMPEGDARAKSHRELVLAGLAAKDAWEFSVSAGELYKLITDAHGHLDPAFRQALQRLAFELADPERTTQLRELLRILPPPVAQVAPATAPARPLVDHAGEPLVSAEAIRRLEAAPAGPRRVELIGELTRWPVHEVAPALEHWSRHGNARERSTAVFALGSLTRSTERSRAAIRAGVDDPDPAVARAAVRALGIHGSASDLPALARAVARDDVADEAIMALDRIGGDEAQRMLAELAQADAHPGRRRLASYLLAARPAR